MTGTVVAWEEVYWEGTFVGIREESDDRGWGDGCATAFNCRGCER